MFEFQVQFDTKDGRKNPIHEDVSARTIINLPQKCFAKINHRLGEER
jgi:hypothetical protein